MRRKGFEYESSISDADVLRTYYSAYCRVKDTLAHFEELYAYLSKNYPPVITTRVAQFLECGFLYMHGRDRCFRPLQVIKGSRLLDIPNFRQMT